MIAAKPFGKSSVDAQRRELDRLAALEELDLLDTPRDEGQERVVRLIRQVFSVDVGLVTLIDAHRQWYKANLGLPFDQVTRDGSFCRHVLDLDTMLVVPDTQNDPRFRDHPAVTGELGIRFYAGTPLRTRDGHIIGSVCAIHTRPRPFSDRDRTILDELAGVAMDRIELQQVATTDSLTRALTRRAFKSEADHLIATALRHKHPLSCIVLDVDHFKTVNDTHGHAAGDVVLEAVAEVCRANLRAGDIFGRLGGEEFSVLLPHCDRDGALAVAEKLRQAIANRAISGEFGTLNVTASFGVSSLSIVGRDIETLQTQADAAMYRSKNDGRNRCTAWNSGGTETAIGARRRVLKAGAIVFNDRRSVIDCTVKSLGSDGAGITVSNAVGIPADFILAIRGEGFETKCRVIAQDDRNLEVAFG